MQHQPDVADSLSAADANSSKREVDTLTGIVLSVQANFYAVQLDPHSVPSDAKAIHSLLCIRRSRLKKIGQRVMVGDRVLMEEPDWAGGRGAIAQVFPRQSELDRPPIANANQIVLVFALADPPLDPVQLSRFLVKAESTALTVQLCLNKQDLVPDADLAQWCSRLAKWGYHPHCISAQKGTGIEPLRNCLRNKTTLVSGPSGVGKSSLLNLLLPKVNLRVGEVSGKLRHGRHTTRHVELFELTSGGLLADSPGFNQPDLNCLPTELVHFFPEARARLVEAACQFNDCLHRDEPGCVVRGDWERYGHYRLFLEEAIARQTALERSPDAEATTKQKVGQSGRIETEPKLSPKRHRRPSRRAAKQALQDWLDPDQDELDPDILPDNF